MRSWVTNSLGGLALVVQGLLLSNPARGAAPIIFHTPNYESPVRGGPDELLVLGGIGFSPGDRVVYQVLREGERPSAHPDRVPSDSTAEVGTASIVNVGNPPFSLTVRLPEQLDSDAVYRLWVVNAASEWSVPAKINDPRPLWVSPAYVYSTADFAGLERTIRVVGRNLLPGAVAKQLKIRLVGPQIYTLSAVSALPDRSASEQYVAEATLPKRIVPGSYAVRVSRGGLTWTQVLDQKLDVLPDPPTLQHFRIDDPDFGSCSAGDNADDSGCLERGIDAARRAGGGVIELPEGTWDLFPTGSRSESEFALPANVHLHGAGDHKTTIIRRSSTQGSASTPLLLLEGNNSISGVKFEDDQHFASWAQSRAIIQLGHRWDSAYSKNAGSPKLVHDIVISQNTFHHVGMAIADSGLPVEHFYVTHNNFGGYARGIEMPGSRLSVRNPFRVDDAIIRWNRFVPGSYVDVSIRQGVMATGLGASRRVDFSSNEADGASTAELQEPSDPPGWRAGFFWNMSGNDELLLVADNRISCSGDKAGDGEAISFDGNGYTFGYKEAQQVTAADANTVSVRGALLLQQNGREIDRDSYYVNHWLQVVAGPGVGQTRRIRSYVVDPLTSTVTFSVAPDWDVIPLSGQTRVVVARQFWQAYIVANEITQAAPPCRKANLNGPYGGAISLWAPSADSVIEGNRQFDTGGILFTQGYSVRTPSCPKCDSDTRFQTALDIRGNLIDGEYDWSSDCSQSGLQGTFGASPTPESSPPIVSFGVQISHNVISNADGLRGGAIDIPLTWYAGPEPHRWHLIDNLVISHNVIRDINGSSPRANCHYGQRGRSGIRIEGSDNVRGTVLYKNTCERVDALLEDSGTETTRVCVAKAETSCECGGAWHANTSK